jgi:hypothetical protein
VRGEGVGPGIAGNEIGQGIYRRRKAADGPEVSRSRLDSRSKTGYHDQL